MTTAANSTPNIQRHHLNATSWKTSNKAILITALVITILAISIGVLAELSCQGVPIGAFNSLGSLGTSGAWSLIGVGSFLGLLDLVSFVFLAKKNSEFKSKCENPTFVKMLEDVAFKLKPMEVSYLHAPVWAILSKGKDNVVNVRFYDNEQASKSDIKVLDPLKNGYQQKDPNEYSSKHLEHFKSKVNNIFKTITLENNTYLVINLFYGNLPCYIVATRAQDKYEACTVTFNSNNQEMLVHLSCYPDKKFADNKVNHLRNLQFKPHAHNAELEALKKEQSLIAPLVKLGTFTIIHSHNYFLCYGIREVNGKETEKIEYHRRSDDLPKELMRGFEFRDPLEHDPTTITADLRPYVTSMLSGLIDGIEHRQLLSFEFTDYHIPFFYIKWGLNEYFYKEKKDYDKFNEIIKAYFTPHKYAPFFNKFYEKIRNLPLDKKQFQILEWTAEIAVQKKNGNTTKTETIQCLYSVDQDGKKECEYLKFKQADDPSIRLDFSKKFKLTNYTEYSPKINLNSTDGKEEEKKS